MKTFNNITIGGQRVSGSVSARKALEAVLAARSSHVRLDAVASQVACLIHRDLRDHMQCADVSALCDFVDVHGSCEYGEVSPDLDWAITQVSVILADMNASREVIS